MVQRSTVGANNTPSEFSQIAEVAEQVNLI